MTTTVTYRVAHPNIPDTWADFASRSEAEAYVPNWRGSRVERVTSTVEPVGLRWEKEHVYPDMLREVSLMDGAALVAKVREFPLHGQWKWFTQDGVFHRADSLADAQLSAESAVRARWTTEGTNQ